jgi:hypothetical protein
MIKVWWYLPIIPALRSLKQEDCEFKASLGYMGRSCPPHIKQTANNKNCCSQLGLLGVRVTRGERNSFWFREEPYQAKIS